MNGIGYLKKNWGWLLFATALLLLLFFIRDAQKRATAIDKQINQKTINPSK